MDTLERIWLLMSVAARRTGILSSRPSLFFGLLVPLITSAQIPTKCFEIESVLVDACTSGCVNAAEGQNEMVRFITGPYAIALSDITIHWPNNTFQGLVQNAATASLTTQLNATITSCGFLLQPTGGTIPPGKRVLLITSTDMCVQANSFAGLSDTLYVIFQNAGNTAGHFANHDNGNSITPVPSGAPSFRTLIMTYIPNNCADTVTYDRSHLVNIYGTYGGSTAENDGATVLFTWPGAPAASYVNHGCQAPVATQSVNIITSGSSVACGGSLPLLGSVSSGLTSLTWSGGSGTFSAPHDSSTIYTAGLGDNGSVTLYLCATGACAQSVCDSVVITVNGGPAAQIVANGPLALCAGDSLLLTASGGTNYSWNTGANVSSITINQPGTYTVTATNNCGTGTASITITSAPAPQAMITGSLTFCAGASTLLTASGGGTYSWSTGANTSSITVSATGDYTVTVANNCGTAQASVTVSTTQMNVIAAASPSNGPAPLAVAFSSASVPPPTNWAWNFGDGSTGSGPAPSHTYTTTGVYTVTLTATDANGCSGTFTLTVVVNDVVVPSAVLVPNVFSPNGDGQNDSFHLVSTGLSSLQVDIYNRWGQHVAMIERPDGAWNGTVAGGDRVSAGTYFYHLLAAGFDGKQYDLAGSLTLLR